MGVGKIKPPELGNSTPPLTLAKDASISDAFWVMQPELLKKLKENVEGFYRSLDWNNLSEKRITENLNKYNLGEQNFMKEYLVRGEKEK